MRNAAFGLLACVSALLFSQSPVSAAPIRVMLLDGQSAGTYHDWQHVTPVLKKELEEAGLFQVDVVTAPPSDEDFSQFNAPRRLNDNRLAPDERARLADEVADEPATTHHRPRGDS